VEDAAPAVLRQNQAARPPQPSGFGAEPAEGAAPPAVRRQSQAALPPPPSGFGAEPALGAWHPTFLKYEGWHLGSEQPANDEKGLI